jgi:hypothetical protein
MATRKLRTAKHSDDNLIPALDPKDADVQYMGTEPGFNIQPEGEARRVALAKAFAWYNRFYTKKDAKEQLIQFLEFSERKQDAKKLRKVHENTFVMTYCWVSRMKMRGLELTEHEEMVLQNEISRLLHTVDDKAEVVEEVVKETTPSKPSIQDILREKAKDAAGELEGMFDEYLADGAKPSHKHKPIDVLAKFNVMPQHVSIVMDVWKRKHAEFAEVLEGKDAQLVQAYNHYTKTQIKNIIKFIDGVIGDLNSYISVKKAAKAPRARKVVPVEKQVAKLKYLKQFKDPVNKLELVSVHPAKLHGASEAWVYDTAKRKLHHYIADEYSKTFTVKGNTLLGFDTNKSAVKTLRKPGEQIKEVMGSKPAARKYFSDIKAVATIPNGRFSDGMVILKAF